MIKKRVHLKGVIITLAVIIITSIIIFPIIYMVPFALMSKSEFMTLLRDFHWFPKDLSWSNFTHIFTVSVNGGTFLRSLIVTLIVAIAGTTLVIIVNILAGYGFARFDFPGKKPMFAMVIFTMFIPGITTMLTSIRLCNVLGLTNTIWVLFLPGVANGYNIFFFRQFYLNFPRELEEAAAIDGCNKLQVFTKIFLPLSSSPIVIIGIGAFMGHWNNYLWPTLTITENEEWLTQVMQVIKVLSGSPAGKYGYGVVIAATLISLIIPFTLYAIFNKKIMEGIASTGMK